MQVWKLSLLFGVALSGCGATQYYVANVYRDRDDLYVQRCAIDAGRHGGEPNPGECKYERVGLPPPEALSAPPLQQH